MLLSTVALVVAARMLVRSDYRLPLALGARPGARPRTARPCLDALDVRCRRPRPRVAAVTRQHERRRLAGAIAIVTAIAILVPGTWYAHQLNGIRQRPLRPAAPREPVWSRRPLGFFVGGGLPEVVTAPTARRSPDSSPRSRTPRRGGTTSALAVASRTRPADGGVRRELVTMSIVGLPFTLLAAAGWLALLGLAVRRPGAPPSVSSSHSFRSPPSPASCTSRPRTRHRTATP